MNNRDLYKDEFGNFHEIDDEVEASIDGFEDDEQELYEDDSFDSVDDEEDEYYDEDEAYANDDRREEFDIDED